MSFNIDELKTAIISSLTEIIGEDFEAHKAFAEKQTKALAKQAAWIAVTAAASYGSPNGFDDEEERDWFLDKLEKASRNFVNTMVALTIITLEKAWNAVVGAIWGAINGVVESAIGVALPIPGVPAPSEA